MFKAAIKLRLPNVLTPARLSIKLALGVFVLFFLLGYQPSWGFPPLKRSVAKAQAEQTQSIQAQQAPITFQLPHPGYLSTYFSRYHPGIDIATGFGMPIKPIAKGVVTQTSYNFWGLGLNVTVNHSYGYESLYAHLNKVYVKKGQNVDSNSSLGEVGLTGFTSGPHTHLEVSKQGKKIDPLTLLPQIRIIPKPEDFQSVIKQEAKPKLDLTNQIQASL